MAARAIESDHDLAFRLQLEEAINASLSFHTSSSSSPPPNHQHPLRDQPEEDVFILTGLRRTLELEKFKQEIADRAIVEAEMEKTREDIDRRIHDRRVAGEIQPEEDVFILTGLRRTLELEKFKQEIADRAIVEAEMEKTREDIDRRIHDRRVAGEIQSMPDEDWEEEGNLFERAYGEGSSHKGSKSSSNIFRVYFKGLISDESVRNSSSNSIPVGIGVAICDATNELVFELKKPLNVSGMSRRAVEFKALIEGLNAAIALNLKRIVFYCDYYPLYQLVTGQWRLPKQQKIAALVTQVFHLQNKFTYCKPTLVARHDIKFAFKFAREALPSSSFAREALPSSSSQIEKENCVICFEDTNITHIFSVDSCNHRYCFSCMRQHMEMKLRIGMTPKCPHDGCNSQLEIESCQKFLTPKLTELMRQRLKEASIPVSDKIYCPYPKCSNLMRKSELPDYFRSVSAAKKCLKCKELFCIECKVPWHTGMSCNQYKMEVPTNQGDAKLKTLADRNLWRQCVKCNHMIELAAGCYHMTCRCGYQFCYTCGAEWKNKKATCACPLWDEQNILEDDEDEEEEFNDDYYESDYSDTDSEYNY